MATERGNVSAAAAVSLTLLVAIVNARFGAEWGQGIHLVYTAAAALVVLRMTAASPRLEPMRGGVRLERPATWQSVLFITTFALVFGTLVNLADVLGAEDPPFGASATMVWIGLILIALSFWFSTGWNSGIATLFGTVTFVVVVVAFVDWVFSPDDVDTFRWILLLTAAVLAAGGAMRRPVAPEHAAGYVNAAGLAILALALTFVAESYIAFFSDPSAIGTAFDVGWGWELLILAAAALLVAYSVAAWQAGPGYLGALNLVAFISLAAGPGEDGPSLIGWPLVLILATLALFAMRSRGGGPWAGVPARPSPEPSEPPTAVQPPS
jgi:hypothetical protein